MEQLDFLPKYMLLELKQLSDIDDLRRWLDRQGCAESAGRQVQLEWRQQFDAREQSGGMGGLDQRAGASTKHAKCVPTRVWSRGRGGGKRLGCSFIRRSVMGGWWPSAAAAASENASVDATGCKGERDQLPSGHVVVIATAQVWVAVLCTPLDDLVCVKNKVVWKPLSIFANSRTQISKVQHFQL